MASTAPPNNNGAFMVVTHVVPPQYPGTNGQTGPGTGIPTPVSVTQMANCSPVNVLQKFLKGQPKALGTTQIMIGVITFLFAIVMSLSARAVSVFSGIVFWGSVIYIITGSLTVAAENNLNSCLVKGSLGMNVVSAITAGIAIMLLGADFAVLYIYCDPYYHCSRYDYMFMTQSYGISGVLLVFAVLQLIISISLSAFGCKATCCVDTLAPVVLPQSIPANYQVINSTQGAFVIPNPQMIPSNPPTGNPPEYNEAAFKPENED